MGGYVLRQHSQKLLRQTCELQLQVERNLDKAFNHQVPDLSINGSLSSIHATGPWLMLLVGEKSKQTGDSPPMRGPSIEENKINEKENKLKLTHFSRKPHIVWVHGRERIHLCSANRWRGMTLNMRLLQKRSEMRNFIN